MTETQIIISTAGIFILVQWLLSAFPRIAKVNGEDRLDRKRRKRRNWLIFVLLVLSLTSQVGPQVFFSNKIAKRDSAIADKGLKYVDSTGTLELRKLTRKLDSVFTNKSVKSAKSKKAGVPLLTTKAKPPFFEDTTLTYKSTGGELKFMVPVYNRGSGAAKNIEVLSFLSSLNNIRYGKATNFTKSLLREYLEAGDLIGYEGQTTRNSRYPTIKDTLLLKLKYRCEDFHGRKQPDRIYYFQYVNTGNYNWAFMTPNNIELVEGFLNKVKTNF